MSFAEWLDELAFDHYKHSFYNCDYQQSERAFERSGLLREVAIFLGVKRYSYFERLEHERAYQECID